METYDAIYKSLTNDGDLSKQYISLIFSDKYEPTIIIRQLILSKEIGGWTLLKKYKDLYLLERLFSMKCNTLINIAFESLKIINERNKV